MTDYSSIIDKVSDKVSSAGKSLYSGSASLGRVVSIGGAILATLVSVLFIAVSVYLFTQQKGSTPTWIGIGMLLLAAVILIAAWSNVFLTKSSKQLAGFEGADSVAHLIRNL